MLEGRCESPGVDKQVNERASKIKLDTVYAAQCKAVILYKIYKEPLSPRRIAWRLLPRRHPIPVPFPKSLSAVDSPPPASPTRKSICSLLLHRSAFTRFFSALLVERAMRQRRSRGERETLTSSRGVLCVR